MPKHIFYKQLDFSGVIDDSRNDFALPVDLMVISLQQLTYKKPFCVYIISPLQ